MQTCNPVENKQGLYQGNPLVELPAELDIMAHMSLIRGLVLQGLESLVDSQDLIVEPQPDGSYLIQLRTTSEALVTVMELLRLSTLLSGRVHHLVKREQVHLAANKQVEALRAQEMAVARLYYEYRQAGYKHRYSLQATVENSPECRQRGWDKAHVLYCTRAYSKEECLTTDLAPHI